MPSLNTIHIGVLVRVEWPIGDDPQNKALQFLQDLLSSSFNEFFDKQDPKKPSTNPYVLKGQVNVQSDLDHGLITIFYS